MRVARLHRRDHVVDGASLERVHGRGPGVVEVAKLRVDPIPEREAETCASRLREPMIVESTRSRSAPKALLRQRQPHRGEARQCEPRNNRRPVQIAVSHRRSLDCDRRHERLCLIDSG